MGVKVIYPCHIVNKYYIRNKIKTKEGYTHLWKGDVVLSQYGYNDTFIMLLSRVPVHGIWETREED